jgi:hypothetical protein
MDAAMVRAMLERQFEHAGDPERSHEMYSEDAVLEFPQSGERFRRILAAPLAEVLDTLIARETIYIAEGFDAPEWRARWRSAP